eukprot:754463-Prymnesium_polylepis.2
MTAVPMRIIWLALRSFRGRKPCSSCRSASLPAADAFGVGVRRAGVSRADSPVRHGPAESAAGELAGGSGMA